MKGPLKAALFDELGFVRKRCRRCGSYFWTLNPDAEFCGDQPCVDYEFLGSPPTQRKGLDRAAVRELFLSFMERHGHTRVRRYPVVARWRDDVFLVGASIYDFQPWVTEGIVPPPANPLAISQPCIRLTDIDNVGRSGRHLTQFEMLAHHAFNYPGKEVYWVDKTVELAFRFFVEELGVPSEKITFKESWWAGGGNAGECFEVLIDGLEVATLVFMHYREVDGRFIEMENRIIDTGYGLERIVWLTQGTPTVYDAVFPRFIDRVRSMCGIPRIEPRIFYEVSRVAGKFDVESIGVRKFHEWVASRLGMDVDELEKLIVPYENIYILADHTRALVFMLGDGIVPSNVGAGYLARLIIRRALRSMMALGLETPLAELVALALEDVVPDFPEYREVEHIILEMVQLEEERYRETLRRGRELVRRRAARLKAQGVSELPVDVLIELYDSHGLDPNIVKEEAEKLGIKVKIPDDFFSRLAERHQAGRPRVKQPKIPITEDALRGLPPTEPLYYKDPYMTKFEAEVLALFDGRFLVLDRTAFYPEGGGQPADHGVIYLPDGQAVRVLDVQKVKNVIVHVLERPVSLRRGDRVSGEIDRDRRLALMRNHTATHILLGAARRVLGPHVWQAGASKGVERSHLDITHYKRLEPDEVKKIELLANRVVMENRRVRALFMERDKAEAKYGFVLYQGGIVPGREIRVVEIEGWDAQACGGTHCSRTGEVGLIKILKTERIQDGVVRIEFAAGEAAIRHVQHEEDLLRTLSAATQTPVEDLPKAVEKLKARIKELRSELERLRGDHFKLLAEHLLASAKLLGPVKLIGKVVELSKDSAIKLAEMIAEKDPAAAVIFVGAERESCFVVARLGEESAKHLDARELARAAAKVLGGGAGGTRIFAQGGGRHREKLDLAINEALKAAEGAVKR